MASVNIEYALDQVRVKVGRSAYKPGCAKLSFVNKADVNYFDRRDGEFSDVVGIFATDCQLNSQP